MMINCAVIIPALNPNEELINYVKALKAKNIAEIIVVNDGSEQDYIHIFDHLHNSGLCRVLTHEMNKGKGRALKTAFNYYLSHCMHLDGVITADSDGQHSVDDVVKLAVELSQNENHLLLGVRDFNESHVPTKSMLGNKLTSTFFYLLFAEKLKDTQTGLRGIPTKQLPEIAKLKGERYEYEILMLIYAKKANLHLTEIPIQTLYFNNNTGSHYHPINDSLKIFNKMISGYFTYFYSIVIALIIDFFCFISFSNVLLVDIVPKARIIFSTVIARVLAITSYLYMNRKEIAATKDSWINSLNKFTVLFSCNMIITCFLLDFAAFDLNLNVILAKISIDLIVGILIFQFKEFWNTHSKKKEQLVGNRHEQ